MQVILTNWVTFSFLENIVLSGGSAEIYALLYHINSDIF
jgi:hypothetical protein